ncbi:ribonuclease H-like domain-containing protein [Blakeslea trispora]|nr:ribonuclease H-like domain-containing protein [Blakeslea trispora]
MLMHVFRRSFHYESVAASLKRHTIPQLKSIAVQSGVNTTGTKPELIDRLTNRFELSQTQQTRSVLSFDLGYRNLAYCHLDRDANILNWARVDLDLPSFHPSVIAPIVQTFIQVHILSSLKTTDKVLIEQQRARTAGGHSVLEHTLRVNCVEAILWTGLYQAVDQLNRAEEIEMLPILRHRVDRFWQAELEKPDESKRTHYQKKRAGSSLVQKWLDTNTVVKCSESLKTMYELEKKQDDMSDCLMQAVAWFHWEKYLKDTCSLYLEKQ